MNYETENIEFKSQFTPEIYKEVIAFANTDGGIIYVGIDDNGQVIGLENVDEEYTKITNGIRDAIMPDVTMFVKFRISGKSCCQYFRQRRQHKTILFKIQRFETQWCIYSSRSFQRTCLT